MVSLKMESKSYHIADGRCVFCTKIFEVSDLTHEHIVPEALHGSLVLKNGSCRECASHSNSYYENKALDGVFKLPRVLLGLKGKRGRASAIDLRHLPPVYNGNATQSDLDLFDRMLDFPVELYPKVFALPTWAEPGLLLESV